MIQRNNPTLKQTMLDLPRINEVFFHSNGTQNLPHPVIQLIAIEKDFQWKEFTEFESNELELNEKELCIWIIYVAIGPLITAMLVSQRWRMMIKTRVNST